MPSTSCPLHGKVREPRLSDPEDLVRGILEHIGENSAREGLQDTPKRVVKSWREIYGGYLLNPADVLTADFDREKYGGMVVMSDIEFYSTCEHHMLPFFGKAHVGYLPGEKVVGASKLARLVDVFARRLQIQERLTTQIATALQAHTLARGVGVVIEARHFCMVCRGVGKQNAIMHTDSLLGFMHSDAATRAEFFSRIQRGK